MASSDNRSILSENFLERYQIISEIDGDSDSDHEDAIDSHEEPEEDEQFDKQFAENPKFREWVLQKKSGAGVNRDVSQMSAYHVAEPSRSVYKSRSSHRDPEICRSRDERSVTRNHHSPSKSSARLFESPKTKAKKTFRFISPNYSQTIEVRRQTGKCRISFDPILYRR